MKELMIKSVIIVQRVIPFLLLLPLIFSACSSSGRSSSEPTAPGAPAITQTEMESPDTLPEETFGEYLAMTRPGPIIPGLFEAAIPQGLAYIPAADMFIISNYMFDGRTAALTLVHAPTGRQEKTVWLYNQDGSRHTGHMGGVAVSQETVWIASSRHFYPLPLSALLNAEDGAELTLPEPLSTEVTCSTAAYADGILYIGEFRSSDGSYSTPPSHSFTNGNHALLAAFELDPATGRLPESGVRDRFVYPDYFLSLPDEVQGEAFYNGYIILSRSYGRTNNSRLSVYTSPLEESPDTSFAFPDGPTVPVWHLDTSRHIKTITAPPMTEGITVFNGKLSLLFESAADKYRRTARYPQDRLHIISPELLTTHHSE